MDEEALKGIAESLSRIADALELLAGCVRQGQDVKHHYDENGEKVTTVNDKFRLQVEVPEPIIAYREA